MAGSWAKVLLRMVVFAAIFFFQGVKHILPHPNNARDVSFVPVRIIPSRTWSYSEGGKHIFLSEGRKHIFLSERPKPPRGEEVSDVVCLSEGPTCQIEVIINGTGSARKKNAIIWTFSQRLCLKSWLLADSLNKPAGPMR